MTTPKRAGDCWAELATGISAAASRAAAIASRAHGHPQAAQDSVACVTQSGCRPLADGRLGRDVTEVIYASYVSAAEGVRIALTSEAAPTGERVTQRTG